MVMSRPESIVRPNPRDPVEQATININYYYNTLKSKRINRLPIITMAEFLNISMRFSNFDLQSGSNAFD